jgi:hypothetical protein
MVRPGSPKKSVPPTPAPRLQPREQTLNQLLSEAAGREPAEEPLALATTAITEAG